MDTHGQIVTTLDSDTLLTGDRGLTVVIAPRPADQRVVELMAKLTERGPLSILDGGNCFPAYPLLRALRATAPDPQAAMQRVTISRAFTCHQVVAMLADTHDVSCHHVILDLLATFYDEQVPLPEVSRLLDGCLVQLDRISRSVPALVTLTLPRTPERNELAERVAGRASRLYRTVNTPEPDLQPALFQG